MSSAPLCPQCNTPLPPGSAAQGLCPRCLLSMAMGGETMALAGEPSEEAGDGEGTYGVYQTIRLLGEGGMGRVYLAEQRQPIRRLVALKVIKLGMDTREVIARFESERQALALMDHSNIAKVLDAGATPQGKPYFVMEYVPGIPITEYCDQNRLTNPQRLELFTQVCQAVQHAHQKGIIHRDIKPSNVLVLEQDGKPVPKVIDFGVAKAVEQRLTEKTVFTQFGFLIGTPEYMSPEQAQLTGQDVDTTTDIYSLGVLLYELLVGVLPFDPQTLRHAAYDEIRRIIREEEPPRPTVRFSSLGASAAEVAQCRHTDVGSMARGLRGDLEWIIMTAMAKDRSRRYASASELAADIGRHLRDEPVTASPPGVMYRARKFLRKHRTVATSVVALVLVSFAGAAVSTIQFFDARHQKEDAQWQSYVANIAAADAHIGAGELAAAQPRLLKCEPSFRGWEWRYLWARSDTSIATLYSSSDVHSIGFSRDGTQVLFASTNQVEVWNASTFALITTYRNLPDILQMSPEGTRILSGGSKDGEPLQVMDPASSRVVSKLQGPSGCHSSFAFSGDSKLVAAGFEDRGVWVWNVDTGNRLAVLTGNGRPVTALTFSNDGTLIAAGAEDGSTRVWEVRSARSVATMSGKGGITAIGFSPDGRQLALGTGGSVQLRDLPSGRQELDQPLETHFGVVSVGFFPDNRRMAVGMEDGSVEVRDARSGRQMEVLSGVRTNSFFGLGASPVVAFNPANTMLLASTGGRDVRVWETTEQATLISGAGIEADRHGSEWSVSRDHIAVVAKNRVYLWKVGSSLPLAVWNGRPGYKKAKLSSDGTLLGTLSAENQITVWNVATGVKVASVSGPNAATHSWAFSGDGLRIAAVSDDKTAQIWDVKSGRLVNAIPVPWGSDVALNPSGTRMAITIPSFDGSPLRLFDVGSGRLLVAADLPRQPRPEALVYFSNIEPGGSVSSVPGDLSWHVGAIEFSPDGKWIANGELTRPGAWLRDSSTASLVSTLAARDFAWKLRFTPDSARLATAALGETVTIWEPSRTEALLSVRNCSPAFAIGSDWLICLGLETGSSVVVRKWDIRSRYYPGARERVEALLQQHFLVAEVVKVLEDDRTTDDALRKAAIAEARRHRDDLDGLSAWTNGVLAEPESGRAQYQLAYDRLQAVAPYRREFHRLGLGMAQYRLGRYTEALTTLTHENNDDGVERIAFLAMTYQRLGKYQDASEQLAKLKQLVSNGQPAGSIFGRLLRESENLIGGSRKK